MDVNLDPRSTDHPHAGFWFCELGDGPRRTGAKYSLNVIDQRCGCTSPGRQDACSAILRSADLR